MLNYVRMVLEKIYMHIYMYYWIESVVKISLFKEFSITPKGGKVVWL